MWNSLPNVTESSYYKLCLHRVVTYHILCLTPFILFCVQLQKSLTNSENERRVVVERLETSQQALAELRRINQHLTDQTQRLQTELANSEVQRSGLESQLRLASWPPESAGSKDEELMQQLQTSQRERMELRGKVESLSDKVDM
jgi:rootletin